MTGKKPKEWTAEELAAVRDSAAEIVGKLNWIIAQMAKERMPSVGLQSETNFKRLRAYRNWLEEEIEPRFRKKLRIHIEQRPTPAKAAKK